ncbi:MAG: glycosyltransferase family 2 protein [Geminicoccaceae bacterium]
MTPAPNVSIVMAAYNAAPFVEEAVRSVRAQTYSGYELIVVNDGSTDDTAAILDRLATEPGSNGAAMSVVHKPNGGLASARNAGMARASSDLVTFLDADDVWEPKLLRTLRDALVRAPDIDVVFPLFSHIDREGVALGVQSVPPKGDIDAARLLVDNPIHSDSGVMMRAAAMRRTAGFDEGLTGYVGLDYWLRVLGERDGALRCIPQPLVGYRRHHRQITSDWRKMEANWRRIMDKIDAGDIRVARDAARAGKVCQLVYWSAVAYAQGDYGAARRLIASAWCQKPSTLVNHPDGLIRTLAAIASYLPAPAHERLRRTFNASNNRADLDLVR